jgi:regulator of protease activity HflC (stomatin/prohibitin superfamily)
MGMIKFIVIIVLVMLAIALIVSNIRIVPQARAYVIERLGAYNGTWQVGLHFKIPLIDK